MVARYFLVAVPTLLSLVSVPLILGKVPRNSFYGVRIHSTMSGPEAEWYRLNRIGGMALFVAGIGSLLAFAILSGFQMRDEIRLVTYSAILFILIIGAVLFLLIRAYQK